MANEPVPSRPQSPTPANRIARLSIPVALAGLGLVALFVLHFPILAILFLLGSGFIGVGSGLYFRARDMQNTIDVSTPEDAQRRETRRRLLRLQGVDGCEAESERAADQLAQADERIRAYDRLLRSKLEPTELTFSRYKSAGDQVYLSMVDRLTEISELLTSIEAIRPTELAAKLGSSGGDAATLRERLQVVETQKAKVRELLAMNERTLTELDRANASLTEMKTQPGLASSNLDAALAQLEELAKRAGRYSS